MRARGHAGLPMSRFATARASDIRAGFRRSRAHMEGGRVGVPALRSAAWPRFRGAPAPPNRPSSSAGRSTRPRRKSGRGGFREAMAPAARTHSRSSWEINPCSGASANQGDGDLIMTQSELCRAPGEHGPAGPRIDGRDKVTGAARYPSDLPVLQSCLCFPGNECRRAWTDQSRRSKLARCARPVEGLLTS